MEATQQPVTVAARVPRRDYSSFGGAISKKVHKKGADISSKAMGALDGVTRDLTVRLTEEASRLAEMDHRITVKPRDVQAAAMLLIPGTLGRDAVAQINPAVAKVNQKYMARKARAKKTA